MPFERQYLLMRSRIPDDYAAITGASRQSAPVGGKGNATKALSSRVEPWRILVAGAHIPETNVTGGGDKCLNVGQHRNSPYPPRVSMKRDGVSGGVERPELDGAFCEAGHEKPGIDRKSHRDWKFVSGGEGVCLLPGS